VFTVEVAINGRSSIKNGPQDTCMINDTIMRINYKAGTNYIIREGFIYLNSTIQCPDTIYGWEPCTNPDNVSFNVPLCGGVTINDNNPQGIAEYDDVIGDWDCRGWFTQDLNAAYEGTFDISTQTFNFTNIPGIGGSGSITTDGAVLQGFSEIKRSVVGGTGALRYVFGEVRQRAIGVNTTGSMNFRTEFDLYILL